VNYIVPTFDVGHRIEDRPEGKRDGHYKNSDPQQTSVLAVKIFLLFSELEQQGNACYKKDYG